MSPDLRQEALNQLHTAMRNSGIDPRSIAKEINQAGYYISRQLKGGFPEAGDAWLTVALAEALRKRGLDVAEELVLRDR